MKITIDFELDRQNIIDFDGSAPSPEVTDAELLLSLAKSDYKQFAFAVADSAIETLEEACESADD